MSHVMRKLVYDICEQQKCWSVCTKPTKWHVPPAKTRISLGIHPVWSESSLKKHWALNYLLSTQWRLWSDWADAHMSVCWFCRAAAQMWKLSLISLENQNMQEIATFSTQHLFIVFISPIRFWIVWFWYFQRNLLARYCAWTAKQ